MVKEKLERPMDVKLILTYNVLHLLFILYSVATGYGDSIGLLYIFALYYDLWKMRKDLDGGSYIWFGPFNYILCLFNVCFS